MASSERTDQAGATTTAAATTTPPATSASTNPGLGTGGNKTSRSKAAALKDDRDAVRTDCLMNARYHSSREAFLDTVHRWFMFGVIIFGAVAIIDIVPRDSFGGHGPVWVKELFAAGAVFLAALDLTFDLSNRARVHSMMKRRYFELLADLDEDKKAMHEMRGCMNRFSADEEPAYHALLSLSWNAAQEMVYGDDAYAYDVPLRHRMFKNFCRFGSSKYPTIKVKSGEVIPMVAAAS